MFARVFKSSRIANISRQYLVAMVLFNYPLISLTFYVDKSLFSSDGMVDFVLFSLSCFSRSQDSLLANPPCSLLADLAGPVAGCVGDSVALGGWTGG